MAGRSITTKLADFLFATKRLMLGYDRVRRTRLYCVGTGKSGTHSISAMFSKNVRCGHEPQATQFIEKILAWRTDQMNEAQFTEWLRDRDRRLALEVDSSTLNWNVIDILLREFSNARFVLTIRDCYSWCNSMLNHGRRFKSDLRPLWQEMSRYRMRPKTYEHAPQDQLLKEMGFYALDCYLAHWTRHNAAVLERVPPERLLVVRTDQIAQRAFEIADFAGLPRRTVRQERTHEFRNPAKQQLLSQIDRGFLEARVEKHCRPLMSRFFPEIKSFEDAPP